MPRVQTGPKAKEREGGTGTNRIHRRVFWFILSLSPCDIFISDETAFPPRHSGASLMTSESRFSFSRYANYTGEVLFFILLLSRKNSRIFGAEC